MAKRRSRSLSLFHPEVNSTARLEGLNDSDDDDSAAEPYACFTGDDCDNPYESEEEEDIPNGQISANVETNNISTSDLAFVRALKLCANINDSKSYKQTLSRLKFKENDELKQMDPGELRAKFDGLVKSMGRYRSFYSVVHDMELFLLNPREMKHPEKPTNPLRPHSLYIKELLASGKTPPPNQNIFKWGNELYKNLSVHDKSRYIKMHEKMMEKYNRQLEIFYEKYPKERPVSKTATTKVTPFNLYFEELRSGDSMYKRADAQQQWKNLSVKKKVSYIKKAFQLQQDGAVGIVAISNKDKKLLENHNGKPEKPPSSIYRLYVQENGELVENPSFSYKVLTTADKAKLKAKLNDVVQKYKEDMNRYIKTLKGDAKKNEKEELMKFLSRNNLSESAMAIDKSGKKQTKRSASLSPSIDNKDNANQSTSPKKKIKLSETKAINEDDADSFKAVRIKAEVSPEPKNSPLKNINSITEAVVDGKKKTKSKENKASKKMAQTSEEPELSPIKKEGVKKKSKKEQKQERQQFTETKPPKNLFKYFLSVNSFSSIDKAKKKYRNLTKSEKKSIQKTYKNICDLYIARLREYLSSLEESEMKAFVMQMEQDKAQEEDTDDGLTSSEDESDSADSSDSD